MAIDVRVPHHVRVQFLLLRNDSTGHGWSCIALVVLGSWRPGRRLMGAILFSAFDAYQVHLQQVTAGVIPYQMVLMLPYILSIVALIVLARRASYPKALMVPDHEA